VWTVYSPMDKDGEAAEAMPFEGLQSTALHNVPIIYHPDTNWTIVYHRIEYSKHEGKPCTCEACTEYLAAIEEKHYS